MGDPENLYQISLLIDHLKHDEVLFREQASRSLALIGEYESLLFTLLTVLFIIDIDILQYYCNSSSIYYCI